jgi:hypothetical protein|tara:strand:+ start:49 stop:297 length:249 start_codon:yes stop_codon:yes gene_type:complete
MTSNPQARAQMFINAVRAVDLGDGVNPRIIVRADDKIVISAEEFDGAVLRDMQINPAIEAVALKHRFDLEFETSAAVICYPY